MIRAIYIRHDPRHHPSPSSRAASTGSAKLLTSHYVNNYGGAVRRLNAIEAKLEKLDLAAEPGFVVNGLAREALIAHNSMVLHEVHFDGLGGGRSEAWTPKPSRGSSRA